MRDNKIHEIKPRFHHQEHIAVESLKPSIFEILKQFELLNKLQRTMKIKKTAQEQQSPFAFYNYRHFLDNFVQECIFGSRNLK